MRDVRPVVVADGIHPGQLLVAVGGSLSEICEASAVFRPGPRHKETLEAL